jgi:acetyl esterase
MALLPYVEKFLEGNPVADLTTAEHLINSRNTELESLPPVKDRPMVKAIENRMIFGEDGHSIPIRIYTPEGEGPFPLFVFFHGGGFVVGNVESYDVTCRILANQTGAKVISVDYRLAPEHPFPAGPEDCYAATKWVAQHAEELNGDAQNIIVGGDSAGGALAAAITLMARDRKTPIIAKQIFLYPVMDFHPLDGSSIYESYSKFAEGYGVTNNHMGLFWDLYIDKEEDRNHPYASPMKASDVSGLPKALLITSENDVLRDEGELYGRRLRDAGVPIITKRFEGIIHGFIQYFLDEEEATTALNMMKDFIQKK